MKEEIREDLEKLGLAPAEARVYLALARNGPLGASAIASATRVARPSVYPTLNSLVDKGLVEAGKGYGSRFSPVPADRALPHLMASDKDALVERERLTKEVIERISSMEERAEAVPHGLIQVIRNPRAVAERFERLQLEAEQQIEICIKAPFFLGGSDNPAQEKVLARGVRARGLYERAVLDAPEVKPFLEKWVSKGEEARIYEGELPHKLALFDRQTVLLPLFMPGGRVTTLCIRHPQLAASLGMLFEFLWERAEPIISPGRKGSASKEPALPARNGATRKRKK